MKNFEQFCSFINNINWRKLQYLCDPEYHISIPNHVYIDENFFLDSDYLHWSSISKATYYPKDEYGDAIPYDIIDVDKITVDIADVIIIQTRQGEFRMGVNVIKKEILYNGNEEVTSLFNGYWDGNEWLRTHY